MGLGVAGMHAYMDGKLGGFKGAFDKGWLNRSNDRWI